MSDASEGGLLEAAFGLFVIGLRNLRWAIRFWMRRRSSGSLTSLQSSDRDGQLRSFLESPAGAAAEDDDEEDLDELWCFLDELSDLWRDECDDIMAVVVAAAAAEEEAVPAAECWGGKAWPVNLLRSDLRGAALGTCSREGSGFGGAKGGGGAAGSASSSLSAWSAVTKDTCSTIIVGGRARARGEVTTIELSFDGGDGDSGNEDM